MNFDELNRRLLALDTACICDANKEIRVLDSAIRPINQSRKLLGIARTVMCRDDFLTVIKALKDAQEGEVLVIDAGGGPRAVAGELFSTEAHRKKLAGMIIDGACRDVQCIRALDFPVYARSISPMAGTTQRVFETQIPVQCGGVTIHPGDLLFGDQDGIIVASLNEMSKVLPDAERIQQIEELALIGMSEGNSLLSLLNFDEHYAKIHCNESSALRFLL